MILLILVIAAVIEAAEVYPSPCTVPTGGE